jgi:hypothetical protein
VSFILSLYYRLLHRSNCSGISLIVIDVKQHAQYNGRTNSQSINLLNNHHKTRFSSTKINNSWSYECLAGNQLPKGQSESVYLIRTVKSRGDMSYTFGVCWFKMCFILRRKTSLVINICIIGNILSMMFWVRGLDDKPPMWWRLFWTIQRKYDDSCLACVSSCEKNNALLLSISTDTHVMACCNLIHWWSSILSFSSFVVFAVLEPDMRYALHWINSSLGRFYIFIAECVI